LVVRNAINFLERVSGNANALKKRWSQLSVPIRTKLYIIRINCHSLLSDGLCTYDRKYSKEYQAKCAHDV
jgi:hypothetical protein